MGVGVLVIVGESVGDGDDVAEGGGFVEVAERIAWVCSADQVMAAAVSGGISGAIPVIPQQPDIPYAATMIIASREMATRRRCRLSILPPHFVNYTIGVCAPYDKSTVNLANCFIIDTNHQEPCIPLA